MDFTNFLDVRSFAIVVGGTLIATVLRCGLGDCRRALSAVAAIGRRSFDQDKVRAELAIQVQEIRNDGILRAPSHEVGDSEFDEVSDALIGRRSIPALLAAHEGHKARRTAFNNSAVRTLAQSSELAPVFGLAGTLLSLALLPRSGISGTDYASTISMAVLATLYGLILANLLLAPLACIINRRAEAEETERQQVLDWLAEQVAASCLPPRRAADRDPAAPPLREAAKAANGKAVA
ncbi:MAG: MotA/TolQ/ExbB proton channel family protein [Novosphingobium sp.]